MAKSQPSTPPRIESLYYCLELVWVHNHAHGVDQFRNYVDDESAREEGVGAQGIGSLGKREGDMGGSQDMGRIDVAAAAGP